MHFIKNVITWIFIRILKKTIYAEYHLTMLYNLKPMSLREQAKQLWEVVHLVCPTLSVPKWKSSKKVSQSISKRSYNNAYIQIFKAYGAEVENQQIIFVVISHEEKVTATRY